MTTRKLPALAGFVLVLAAGIALIAAGVGAAHPATYRTRPPHLHSAVYHRPASTVRNS